MHPGALEPSSDGDFASSFEDTRRGAQALIVELWIPHAVAIAKDVESAPGSIGAIFGMRTERADNSADAPNGFGVTVPVEIRVGAAKAIAKMVRTEDGPVKFTASVPGAGPGVSVKVTLDPGWSVLRR